MYHNGNGPGLGCLGKVPMSEDESGADMTVSATDLGE
ncbi:hypothetical protein ABIB34_003858 [Rhodococcus sp. UYP5]